MEQDKVFIKKILKDMPRGLTDLERARYLYIVLGKEKSYDEEFWFANSKTKQKIFREKHAYKINFDKLIENKKVVCTSISKIYSVILKQMGINNYIQRDDLSDEHIYVVLNVDGKEILADLQRDLSNIQANKSTEYFGTEAYYNAYGHNYETIEDEKLEKIDRKIGYTSVKQDYLNNDIFYLKSLVKKQKDLYAKMNLILRKTSEYNDSKNMRYIELVQNYKWILAECLDEKELKNIISTNCYRKNGDKKQYISCFLLMVKMDIKDICIHKKRKDI